MLPDRKRTWSVAAWLAFLAMAMLFVAPVISRSLPHAEFAAQNTLAITANLAVSSTNTYSDVQSGHHAINTPGLPSAAAPRAAESGRHSAMTMPAAPSPETSGAAPTAAHPAAAAATGHTEPHSGSHHAMAMPAGQATSAHTAAESGAHSAMVMPAAPSPETFGAAPTAARPAAAAATGHAEPHSGSHHAMAMPTGQATAAHTAAESGAHSAMTMPVTHGHLMMSGRGMSPMEEIACGYCQLLIHLPFIQFALALLLVLLLRYAVSAPRINVTCTTLTRPWSPQRARAPPAVPYCSLTL